MVTSKSASHSTSGLSLFQMYDFKWCFVAKFSAGTLLEFGTEDTTWRILGGTQAKLHEQALHKT